MRAESRYFLKLHQIVRSQVKILWFILNTAINDTAFNKDNLEASLKQTIRYAKKGLALIHNGATQSKKSILAECKRKEGQL